MTDVSLARASKTPRSTTELDEVQGFWDSRPCNIRHSPAPVGTRAYFDEVEARKYFVEPHIPGFAQFARWKGKRVLEIGCGIGTDSVNFVRAGAHLTAVDLSAKSLDVCRRRLEVFGFSADVRQADAERLSEFIPEEPFDLIYSFGVIHHTPNPANVIRELSKFCGPSTEIRLMLYSRWSWKGIAIMLRKGRGAFWRRGELIARHAEANEGCPVAYTYGRRDVVALLSGFAIQDMWKDHIFPYIVDDYVKYRYRRHWYFAALPTAVFHWLERRLGWHTLVVASPLSAGGTLRDGDP